MEPALPGGNGREERIAARRARIQARIQATRDAADGGARKAAEEEKRDPHLGKAHKAQVLLRLARLKLRGNADVTAPRVAGDEREQRRRQKEEEQRQNLRTAVLAEAEASLKSNADVAAKWAALFTPGVPQDLAADIEKQRQACAAVIANKDALIGDLRAVLKDKDEDYVRALKQAATDIEALLAACRRSFQALQAAYREDLAALERSFLADRARLLTNNKAEIAALFEARRARENAFLERCAAATGEYWAALEALRASDAEQYARLKGQLETDIHNLEQHLQHMRATYQLNTEKLEYNWRVLLERDTENGSTVAAQKRKLARQRDVLSGLKAAAADVEKRQREADLRVTDEYRRCTEQFKDLQDKVAHFARTDRTQYAQLFEMKQGKAARLVTSLLRADKVLHEQQLGWAWHPPSADLFQPVGNLPAEGGENEAPEDPPGEREGSWLEAVGEEYRQMLQMLCDEAGYLVPGKVEEVVRDASQGPSLVSVDALLGCLGVSSPVALASLQSYLTQGSERDPPGTIPPDRVARQLRAFVEAQLKITGGYQSLKLTKSLSRKTTGLREPGEEREYWQRMANVVAEKSARAWGALEAAQMQYHKLLTQRANTLEDIRAIESQNTEIRQLLSQYMAAKVNDQLKFPPSSQLILQA
ncbi:hypothetical protein KFL_004690070 [Klebsormidium nitens]|uniref:Dynein regulatory complex protein 1 n=1 Tax=Klebsormidium nitens TaxID=105231 RepID=A0A1Y1ID80_KLENI|nr:hypothetical protein KFL_004690070 [Klebsormidium nitens]|eukprot:GAQ88914.1 hypothetical protein KFL_004690070 [Klebsormidium nitens]